MPQPRLTDGLRLALEMAQEIVDSFETSHPWPQWKQALAWRDIERELLWAGFCSHCEFRAAHVMWLEERRIQRNHPSFSGAGLRVRPSREGNHHTEPPVAMRQNHEEEMQP